MTPEQAHQIGILQKPLVSEKRHILTQEDENNRAKSLKPDELKNLLTKASRRDRALYALI